MLQRGGTRNGNILFAQQLVSDIIVSSGGKAAGNINVSLKKLPARGAYINAISWWWPVGGGV